MTSVVNLVSENPGIEQEQLLRVIKESLGIERSEAWKILDAEFDKDTLEYIGCEHGSYYWIKGDREKYLASCYQI